jgi:hypothetical protein
MAERSEVVDERENRASLLFAGEISVEQGAAGRSAVAAHRIQQRSCKADGK